VISPTLLTEPEYTALPRAWSTRQSLKNTRQTLCRVSHSTKRARHTVHRQSCLCRVLFLGHSPKVFAECQRALGKEKQPLRRWVTETETLPSVPCDTRQRSSLCRVSAWQHSTKNLPEGSPLSDTLPSASLWHSAKRASLPSAKATTLDKEPVPVPRSWFFAECYGSDTRQSDQYAPFLFVFPIPSKQTKDISQISHIYITDHHRHI
jgi:hypothetical protein